MSPGVAGRPTDLKKKKKKKFLVASLRYEPITLVTSRCTTNIWILFAFDCSRFEPQVLFSPFS